MWIEFRSTKSATLLMVQLAEAGCAFQFYIRDGLWRHVCISERAKDKFKRMLYVATQSEPLDRHNISQSLYEYKMKLIAINRKRILVRKEETYVDRT